MSLLDALMELFVTASPRFRPRSKRNIPAQVQQLESRTLLSGTTSEFADPHPVAGNQFGATVTVLTNGNVVITSPNDDAGGGSTAATTGAGAVYLFNDQTGTLISTLTGSHAGDQLGSSGVTALTNGNFVIDSPDWNGNRGAVTWGSETTGVKGTISSANSLVGSTANDQVGFGGAPTTTDGLPSFSGVTALSNGNYVVDSPVWNNGRGAVTWGSGTAGVVGTVSAANSLVGTDAHDVVGSDGVTALSNGSYVVDSSNWNNGAVGAAGAVTWGSGTAGVVGAVSAANSLVGTSVHNHVGVGGITALINGNYVVDSSYWNNGTVKEAGAVTFGNGTTGVTGIVSAANSLVGSTAGDLVGVGGITALSNGNFVVTSPSWNGNRGAVTLVSGTTGMNGTVSAANSLVGTTNGVNGDSVGSFGVRALINGNFVVASSKWNDNQGAVTFVSGTTGMTGAISAANSLVGTTSGVNGDSVGSFGITALSNGNYVVDSFQWNDNRGAVTFGNGISGVKGVVSAANSLVGSTGGTLGVAPIGDEIGVGGVTVLTNGNYIVDSPPWSNGSVSEVGAVTWGSGMTGVSGIVSPTNSLVGVTTDDLVGDGGVAALINGNYVVDSRDWNNGAAFASGAVTFGNGTTGVTGTVSSINSLVGTHNFDQVGGNEVGGPAGVIPLSNGNYVVDSFLWNNGSVAASGAVTLGSGTTGVSGTINAANSLIGTNTLDEVGGDPFGGHLAGVIPLSNGNFVVNSPVWSNNVGAVTFGNGTTGVVGVVSVANSVVGQSANSSSNPTVFIIPDNAHGAVYAAFPGDGSGHVYRGSAATGFSNFTFSGPSITVSDYSGGVSNVTGSVNFGTATLGTPITQVITITNSGNSPLFVSSLTVPTGFSVLNNFVANHSIASGASISFTLQLDATATGTSSGVATFGTNVPLVGTFRFLVTGTVAAPKLMVRQGSTTLANGTGLVNLGNTLVGTPVVQVITVTNTGKVPLILTSVTVPTGFSVINDFATITTNPSIAAGASASFTLQLNATASGTPGGVVTIADNDPTASPFTFLVTGTVTAPKIVVQQGATTVANGTGAVSLGSTPVGTPVTQVITVTNSGNSPLIVQPVTVPAGFSIVGGTNFTANQSIGVGASASFTVRLNATAVGNPTGLVTIANSDTTASPFTFQVTGVVTPVVTTVPVLVVQQGATTLANGTGRVFFNSVPAGTAVSQVITVANHGNAPLVVQPVTLPGVGFSILNNFTVNQSIAAGTSASFTIQLNANASGTPTGVVTLSDNDPTASPFTFNVVANHLPTAITLSNSVVATNFTSVTPVGVLTTADPDASAVPQTFSYAVASPTFLNGPTAIPVFSLDSQGHLTLAASAPVGVYGNLPITSRDQGGLSITPNFTIYATGTSTAGLPSSVTVNSGTPGGVTIASLPAPVIEVQNAPGNPNAAVSGNLVRPAAAGGSVLAAASATSQNSNTRIISVLTYQLGVGGDNSSFTIDASGRLQTAVALEASVKSTYHITIISTNTITGLSTVNPYTITIAPVLQNTIVVKPATFTLAEASANGTTVGTVSATGVGGQTPTYAITGGNSGNAFAINGATGQIRVANSSVLHLNTNPTFSLTVQATDNGASGSATITINLARITLSNSSVAETAAIGTVIGQFSTIEAVAGNTFHYSLVPGQDSDAGFTIDASGHLKLNVSLYAPIKNSFTIDVTSTNQNQQSITQTFTITVLGPSNIALSNSSVAENAKIGTVIGQFSTTDAGAGNTFTYKLPAATLNNADFTLDASGHLKLNAALNAAVKNSYLIEVVSTDQRGLSVGKAFAITVLGPSNIALSNSSVVETAKFGTVIGQFSTTDAGPGNTFTYTLPVGKLNNADFTVDASGHLKLNAGLNAAVKNSYTIEVVSTDQRGLSVARTFTIMVLGPSNITLSNSGVAENAVIGTVIGQFSTTDAGTGNTFTYKLPVGALNNADFTVDSNGHLKLNTSLYAPIKNSYTIYVVSTDQRGLAISKSFTIAVLGPSNITLSNTNVAATAKIGTVIGVFSTTDAGTGNTFTYTLLPGELNNADFTVDASGHLKLNVVLNAAVKNSYTIYVVSTDQRGLAIAKTFTIKVT